MIDDFRIMEAIYWRGALRGYGYTWPTFEKDTNEDPRWEIFAIAASDGRAFAIPPTIFPPAVDVAVSWRNADNFAQSQGYFCGFPAFESAVQPSPASHHAYGVAIEASQSVQWHDVPLSEIASGSDVSFPGALIREINQWAVDRGYAAGVPNFNSQVYPGTGQVFGAITFDDDWGLTRDSVPQSEFLVGAPHPPPILVPNATGLSLPNAIVEIQRARLRAHPVKIPSWPPVPDDPSAKVVRQAPSPGAPVEINTIVEISHY